MKDTHKLIHDLFRKFKEFEEQESFFINEKNVIEEKGALFGIGQNTNEELEHIKQVEDELNLLKLKIREIDDGKTELLKQIFQLATNLLDNVGHPNDGVLVSYQGNSFKIIIEEFGGGIDKMKIVPLQ